MWGLNFKNPGPWGPGGGKLTSVQADNNTWTLAQQIEAKQAEGVGIADVILTGGNQLYFQLTDHTYIGPVTIPITTWNAKGAWQPNTAYLANDVVTYGTNLYLVMWAHTSQATFDPHANDGLGHDYYQLLVDLSDALAEIALSDLQDVALHDPLSGEVLTYMGGKWINAEPTGGGLGPGSDTDTFQTLADVYQSPAPTNLQLVYWTSTADAHHPLGGFTYVTPTSAILQDFNLAATNGNVIVYNSGFAKWESRPFTNYQLFSSNTTYTLGSALCYTLINYNNSSPGTYSIDTNSGENYPAGAYFVLRQNAVAPLTINGVSGVTIYTPNGRAPTTRTLGSVMVAYYAGSDVWYVSGDLAYAPYNYLSGGTAIDPTTADLDVVTLTPSASETLTMASAPLNKRITIVLTTSGTTSYTITFGSGFKSTGTLTTGTVSGKVFTISFIGDGTNMNEVSRTAAM